MNRVALVCTAGLLALGASGSMYDSFVSPDDASRPWTYWLWENSHVDEKTIREDLADIANLGFGAVLMSDSRGYWDDEDHVAKPPPKMTWGSGEWLDRVAFAIRTCAENGLGFTMNVAASGGKLNGGVKAGADAPKVLVCRRYAPGVAPEPLEGTGLAEVALFSVDAEEPLATTDWVNAGDGFYTMSATSGRRADGGRDLGRVSVRGVRELGSGERIPAGRSAVRFAWRTIPGHETDIDILDPAAVTRHLERVIAPIIARVPGLVGSNRTFRAIYNVSWEGAMPTWSPTFEADYAKRAGKALRPLLPVLAGIDLPGTDAGAFMTTFRRVRSEMMRDNFYGTLRDWAHAHGMLCYSESGGPWVRSPQVFGEVDQLSFLNVNDIPQGEFWPMAENQTDRFSGQANENGRYMLRGQVSCAHIYGKRLVSAEAFTHMHRHWTVDPEFLKPVGDQAYADGANLLVWHTYTASPESFGVPGLEYFAGSHINRNVTWHDELPAFIAYLARCQSLLQRGEPVTDIAVLGGDRCYQHWGRWRDRVSDEIPVSIPAGYAYDLVNDDALARVPGLLDRYRIVYDARPASARYGTVPVGDLKPDAYGPYTWCHRRDADADWYFLVGQFEAEMVFRQTAPSVEIWDPVTGRRFAADAKVLPDGRTSVRIGHLQEGGSCFVVFNRKPDAALTGLGRRENVLTLTAPWRVSFACPRGISAPPPDPVVLPELVDFVSRDDLCHFSGTAVYRTAFDFAGPKDPSAEYLLTLGWYRTGLAHVYLNGTDCGTVWCFPHEADVTAALKEGRNELEIRYVNNWCNRLVGDAKLPESERVTKTVVRFKSGRRSRGSSPSAPWYVRPTPVSGYVAEDTLQSSGLMGRVRLDVRARIQDK